MGSLQIIFFIALNFALAKGAPFSSLYSEAVESFDENSQFLDESLALWAHRPRFEQLKVEKTQDIIDLLLAQNNDPLVGKLVEILKTEEVRVAIDGVFQRLPKLPMVIKGLEEFFSGPEAKPLVDALEQSIPQLKTAILTFYQTIQGPLESLGEVFAEEGIKIFFRLQSPEVMQVIQKLQELPEIQQVATYLNNYNIDLLKALKKLETIIQGGL